MMCTCNSIIIAPSPTLLASPHIAYLNHDSNYKKGWWGGGGGGGGGVEDLLTPQVASTYLVQDTNKMQ